MGQAIAKLQNWYYCDFLYIWINFQDYVHYNGDVITIARTTPKEGGFTKTMMGKYKVVKGKLSNLTSDDLKSWENPKEWFAAEQIYHLRMMLNAKREKEELE